VTDRINFLEKGKYVLTYKKMAMAVGLWFVLCFVVFFSLTGYKWLIIKGKEKYVKHLAQLNTRKERTMALIEAQSVPVLEPQVKKLSEVYDHFPNWSAALVELSENIPSQVWLTNVTSTYLSDNGMYRRVEISGNAKNISSIANFSNKLNKSSLFRNVVLNKSSRVEGSKKSGYSFVLLGEIVFGAKIWN